jgi:hypothetical protein
MGSALVLVCAIGCTLVAAYQWAGRVGAFGAANSVLAERDWQGRAWSTALAVILWLVWLILELGSIHARGPHGEKRPAENRNVEATN